MSALAGLIDTRRDPAALVNAVAGMVSAMAHRGPDGAAHWRGEHEALGHGWLDTTGARDFAVMERARATFAITGDIRLENREELLAALGIGNPSTSDAILVLESYLTWGEAFPARLHGDFAFAIWNGEKRELFCARDHFGVRPFYFMQSGSLFAFASEIKGILALGHTSATVSDIHVSAFLAGMPPDDSETPYRDIKRLPRAHCMTVSAQGLRISRYWNIEPVAPRRGRDHAEEFKHIFTGSVKNKMHGPARLGTMLSGGMDSSSIACVAGAERAAAGLAPLPTFSVVFSKLKQLDESRYIEAVLAKGGFSPNFIDIAEEATFEGFDRVLTEHEETCLAPGLQVVRRLYKAASANGIRVLLDGHGGDEVVSHGDRRLHELAENGRWIELWRELRGMAGLHGGNPAQAFLQLFDYYRISRAMPRLRRVVGKSLRCIRPAPAKVTGNVWQGYVRPELASRSGLAERYWSAMRIPPHARTDDGAYHLWRLEGPLVSHAFEVLGKSAAAAGVEPRYPFWDKAVVQFCLALPSDQKARAGWSRYILRNAMEGVLPPQIQWRHDKIDFTPNLIRGMANQRGLIEGMLGEGNALAEYVDVDAVKAAFARVFSQPDAASGFEVQFLWRTIALGHWLRQVEPSEQSS